MKPPPSSQILWVDDEQREAEETRSSASRVFCTLREAD